LLGLVAGYSFFTAVFGTRYETCVSVGTSAMQCSTSLEPIPVAYLPAVLAVIGIVGSYLRIYVITWAAIVPLIIFGFLSGLSIGGPIFLGAVAAAVLTALSQTAPAGKPS
jgi:hypothetical protein